MLQSQVLFWFLSNCPWKLWVIAKNLSLKVTSCLERWKLIKNQKISFFQKLGTRSVICHFDIHPTPFHFSKLWIDAHIVKMSQTRKRRTSSLIYLKLMQISAFKISSSFHNFLLSANLMLHFPLTLPTILFIFPQKQRLSASWQWVIDNLFWSESQTNARRP